LGPWIIRNATLAAYAGFTPAPDYILYFYSAAAVKAKAEHKKFSQVQEELGYGEWGYVNNVLYLQRHPEQRTWSQADIFRFEGAEARRTIFQDPRLYSLIHLKGCTIVILDPGVTDLLKTVRLYPEDGGLLSRVIDQGPFRATLWLIRNYPFTMVMLFLLGTQLIVYYILALAGLRRLPMHARVFFAWTALYFVLVSGGPAGLARYRVPIMPLICISAGVAVAYWTAKTAPQKDPSALRDASAEFSR
ncbi:MAG TPA: hypothetical protein VGR03_14600, partial [Candidatus Acidoferrum sp.]|nr:hypothetical protein [Candidatus Acidoferrum sp.]